MEKKKKSGAREWIDPDDAPEITFPKKCSTDADWYHGDKLIRRGRPPLAAPKQAIKLRLDAEVVEHFRATGPGWQTRINDGAAAPRRETQKGGIATSDLRFEAPARRTRAGDGGARIPVPIAGSRGRCRR